MNRRPLICFIFASALIGLSVTSPAQKPDRGPTSFGKTSTNDVARPMLVNNVFSYYTNDGTAAYNVRSTNNAGFEFPKGTGQTLVFEEGIVWGCRQNDTLKVGGSTYRPGLQAGPILIPGSASNQPVAADASAPENRAYRVRPDIRPIPGVTSPANPIAAAQLSTIAAEELSYIGRYEQGASAASILQQYWDDWNEWPAGLGAPYTDVDHNGSYDPTIDIPGVPLAGQTIWYVANDLNPFRVGNFSASRPIGLEMQKTVWGFNIPGPPGNTLFTSTRLINKSGMQLDSMYIAQWSDTDVGSGSDDALGCDTLLNLAYAYNGVTVDPEYGADPPAVGYDLLQGPMVKGAFSDTATFGYSRRPGFRNLPMSAFVFFSGGSPFYSDPPDGKGADVAWNRLFHGTTAAGGLPFIDPTTGLPVKFCLAGDPVKSTDGSAGWVFGLDGLRPQDVRLVGVTGPFSMAAGDTQEVVVACIAARGADRLSSVTALRSADQTIQRLHDGLYRRLPPALSRRVSYNGGQSTIAFRADARSLDIDAMTVELTASGGAFVTGVPLADDGLHGDDLAGDGVFGGSVQLPQRSDGLDAAVAAAYHDGTTLSWPGLNEMISTANLSVSSYEVVSDNINGDLLANPGENVRFVISIRNASPLALTGLTISTKPAYPHWQLRLPVIHSLETRPWVYDADDPSSYLDFDVPGDQVDPVYAVVLLTTDGNHNLWADTLRFPVAQLPSHPHRSYLPHTDATVSGDFEVLIVDSLKTRNHVYMIRGVEGEGGGYTVQDSTTGEILLTSHALPDSLGHTSPAVDGFKVLLGSINTLPGLMRWAVPSGVRRFSPVGGFIGVGLEGFGLVGIAEYYDRSIGTIGAGRNFTYDGIQSNLAGTAYHSVLLKLAGVNDSLLWDPLAAQADTNFSRAYRWLQNVPAGGSVADPASLPWIINTGSGFPYQDYNYAVAFSAWDVDVDPPVRLSVGMMENNVVGGRVDGRYWPGTLTTDNRVSREVGLIFAIPYSPAPDPSLQIDLANSTTPLMWVMTPTRREEVSWTANDQFLLTANRLPGTSDLWKFNPFAVMNVEPREIPTEFALLQNYPNPFNPTTVVSWQLPVVSRVRLEVYDVLGRRVTTLVDGILDAGVHSVMFNARNIASGVYFYKLEATAGEMSYVATKKMMVIK